MFRDRHEAGAQLGARLAKTRLVAPVVLALPRGGVPVGYEVARTLNAPLDVFVVRKIGAPGQPELGVGAIAEGGTTVLDEITLRALRLTPEDLEPTIGREREELERRVRRYRATRELPDLRGRTVLLVDDGLATGVSARAALRALRRTSPGRLMLAVPVCAAETGERIRADADDIVCLKPSRDFVAVGRWYEDFGQISDETVVDLLARAQATARP